MSVRDQTQGGILVSSVQVPVDALQYFVASMLLSTNARATQLEKCCYMLGNLSFQ